jgi:hypothetical protein
MTPHTPVEAKYTTFSCPNPACCWFNQPGEGNIVHRSWTGKHKHIERLRCTECGAEFSEREGTLMAHSKLSEETVERLVKCQRWGVCDEGTADICEVDIKTVHRFQKVASQRAEEHHRQVVVDVSVDGVQLDEAYSKLRGGIKAWIHTALAMGSLFLLWVDVGPRTQEMAAGMIAQVVARVRSLPMFFTDGWKAYASALLEVLGVIYRPRRRGKVGRKPKPRLVAPKRLFYAQVVKTRNRAGQVMGVCTRVVFGGPRRFFTQMRLRELGTTIHTAFVERWYGTVRGLIAPLRRRSRCLSWRASRHRGRLWVLVDLYNFVMPHRSLRQGNQRRTPAMAIGLTDHVWTYREYMWLPVHPDETLRAQMDQQIQHLLKPALEDTPCSYTRRKSPPSEAEQEPPIPVREAA